MTNLEFSDEFDVLYNNVTSNQAPGLDEYEKSVFLTKALDEIIKSYFNPKLNKPQEGFDGSERRLIDFSMLIVAKEYKKSATPPFVEPFLEANFDRHSNSKSVKLDSNILMIINELLQVSRGSEDSKLWLLVIPISYTEYTRLMSKPFKRPLHYLAWRVSNSSGSGTMSNYADLIVGPGDTIKIYSLRYIKRPRPIVLALLEGVSIDGDNGEGITGDYTSCELDPILHHEILQRAVELAKAAYTGDLSSQIALGQSSGTEMGIVTSNRQ